MGYWKDGEWQEELEIIEGGSWKVSEIREEKEMGGPESSKGLQAHREFVLGEYMKSKEKGSQAGAPVPHGKEHTGETPVLQGPPPYPPPEGDKKRTRARRPCYMKPQAGVPPVEDPTLEIGLFQQQVQERQGEGKKLWPLETGKRVANEVMAQIVPYCKKAMICGSIRRKKKEVRDADLVVVPDRLFLLEDACKRLAEGGWPVAIGAKIISFGVPLKKGTTETQRHREEEVFPVEIYVAHNGNYVSWCIARTGSKENNIRLCSAAKRKGLKIAWDEGAIIDRHSGQKVREIITEKQLWAALMVEWQEPKERD